MGLAAVPMFGAERKESQVGRYAILLDGESASAAIVIAASSSLPDTGDALSWAWSSNVTHSLLVDVERRAVEWRRWDRPGESRTLPIPSRNVPARLDSLLRGPSPERSATVITKAINLFSAIRDQIARSGGSSVDAIAAFNRLLFWAATDAEALSDLRQRPQLQKHLRDLPSTPAGSLVPENLALVDIGTTLSDFFAFDPETHLVLDPELLLRHASGYLFQEAHRVIARDDQAWLFPVAKNAPSGPLKRKDIHFTPPSLARLLTENAMMAMSLQRPRPSPMIVADPACGSGEFLLEAAHYSVLNGPLLLHGMDSSPESCEMARFALWWAVGNESLIIETDSLLEGTEWRTPNVVLMNPPFTSWEEMDDRQRAAVDKILGSKRHGRPDISLAFLFRALAEVQPGGVVASIVPASFLDSDFAAKVRRDIASSGKFHVRLIGHFKDLGYFREATVEPAFVVIQKSRDPDTAETETLFLEAERGYTDNAIRGLRRFTHGGNIKATSGWRLFSERLADREANWKPSARRSRRSRAEVAGIKTVGDLFDVRLGARVGDKKALMITRQELSDLPKSERRLFMPVADNVKDGRIIRSDYIFFPYDDRGQPLAPDEATLSELVPVFYDRKLNPARPSLEARRSHAKPWWFLARPRSWQKSQTPRLVSKAFGRRGDFAFDPETKYAVVQGVAWFLKREPETLSALGYAYLSLLNSAYFESLLAEYCPQVRGGQFNLSRKYVATVPLPDLSSKRESPVADGLATIGKQMADGDEFDARHLETLTGAVYGLPSRVQVGDPDATTIAKFIFLAHQCIKATQHCSRSDQIARHPSHKAIVSMGRAAVGLLLRDLQRSGGYWFTALYEITKESPVPSTDSGHVPKMIDAWLKWGKQHGYIPQE